LMLSTSRTVWTTPRTSATLVRRSLDAQSRRGLLAGSSSRCGSCS